MFSGLVQSWPNFSTTACGTGNRVACVVMRTKYGTGLLRSTSSVLSSIAFTPSSVIGILPATFSLVYFTPVWLWLFAIFVDQALEQVLDDVRRIDVFDDIGIDRVDIVQHAVVEGLVVSQLGAVRHLHGIRRQREGSSTHESQGNRARPQYRLEFHIDPSPL